jgi:hypothetical protein
MTLANDGLGLATDAFAGATDSLARVTDGFATEGEKPTAFVESHICQNRADMGHPARRNLHSRIGKTTSRERKRPLRRAAFFISYPLLSEYQVAYIVVPTLLSYFGL